MNFWQLGMPGTPARYGENIDGPVPEWIGGLVPDLAASVSHVLINLDGGVVCPGFALPLDELFAELDRSGG